MSFLTVCNKLVIAAVVPPSAPRKHKHLRTGSNFLNNPQPSEQICLVGKNNKNRLRITPTLKHQAVVKLRGQQPSVKENQGFLGRTSRKKWVWILNGLIQFHLYDNNCYRFPTHLNLERWKGGSGDQEQNKNFDSYVSCHLPLLTPHSLFTLALIWIMPSPPIAATWGIGDLLHLTVPKRSSRSHTDDRSNPSLHSCYICWHYLDVSTSCLWGMLNQKPVTNK